MQTVFTILEINPALGAFGFSFLQEPLFGPLFGGEPPARKTVVYIRDTDGLTQNVLIVPAETVRGAF
jgi:hypothetical protein